MRFRFFLLFISLGIGLQASHAMQSEQITQPKQTGYYRIVDGASDFRLIFDEDDYFFLFAFKPYTVKYYIGTYSSLDSNI